MSSCQPAPPTKPNLDDNLPTIISGNLADFQKRYQEIADQENYKTSEFGSHTHFALTGQYRDQDLEEYQMKVDPSSGHIPSYHLKQHADVDSVIGFVYEDDTFPLLEDHTFFYQVLNNTDFTLETSLHLPPYNLAGPNGEATDNVSSLLIDLEL
jgi:hypothetical protein